MTVPVWVRSPAPPDTARAMPKSATLTSPPSSMMTLAGLMSRWTTPLRWANPSADATPAARSAARSGLIGAASRMISARVRPETYSITMK